MSVTAAAKTFLEAELRAGRRVFASNLTRRLGINLLDIAGIFTLIRHEGTLAIDQGFEPFYHLAKSADGALAPEKSSALEPRGALAAWERQALTRPDKLVSAMARDCLDLFEDRGDVTIVDLCRLGWTAAQVNRYGEAAKDEFIRMLGLKRARRDDSATAEAA